MSIQIHMQGEYFSLYINMSHMWRFGRSLSKASGQNICQSYNEQICFCIAFVWFEVLFSEVQLVVFHRMIQNI